MLGLAIAQVGQGLVFDPGAFAMPRQIQCRTCRQSFALVEEPPT